MNALVSISVVPSGDHGGRHTQLVQAHLQHQNQQATPQLLHPPLGAGSDATPPWACLPAVESVETVVTVEEVPDEDEELAEAIRLSEELQQREQLDRLEREQIDQAILRSLEA